MSNGEKRILAALANAEARRAYAEVILGQHDGSVPPSPRRGRALRLLTDAGLIRAADPPNSYLADDGETRRLLAAGAPTRKVGVERFLRDGRIDQYPANAAQRRTLLAWVAERVIESGEDVAERDLNARLADYHDDHATLRRYLVDSGLVERMPDGSTYRRAGVADLRLFRNMQGDASGCAPGEST